MKSLLDFIFKRLSLTVPLLHFFTFNPCSPSLSGGFLGLTAVISLRGTVKVTDAVHGNFTVGGKKKIPAWLAGTYVSGSFPQMLFTSDPLSPLPHCQLSLYTLNARKLDPSDRWLKHLPVPKQPQHHWSVLSAVCVCVCWFNTTFAASGITCGKHRHTHMISQHVLMAGTSTCHSYHE